MKISQSWKNGNSRKIPPVKPRPGRAPSPAENPAASHESPAALVASTTLTDDEKGAALKTWGDDALRLSIAADEGMTGGERSMLPEVKAAEAVLEQAIEAEKSPEPAKAKASPRARPLPM